jgi:hypothetical protein
VHAVVDRCLPARSLPGAVAVGRALGHARQALDLLTAPGDAVRRAAALNHVGWLRALLGEYEQAVACCSEALVAHERADYRHGMAAAREAARCVTRQSVVIHLAGGLRRQAVVTVWAPGLRHIR